MPFSFDQVFAVDPANTDNVAGGASVLIFAPGDATKTPLTITTPDGAPLANPIPTNANGFGSAFAHATLDRVAWEGGGFTGFFTSYEGLKQVAVNAEVAAQTAAQDAADAAVLAQAPTDDQVDAGIQRADLDGRVAAQVPPLVQSQVPPLVQSQVPPLVAQSIASDPTVANSAATMAQSTAGLVPVWKASTAYTAGQRVIAPNGDVVAAKATFTSKASYVTANWTPAGDDVDNVLFGVVDQNDRQTALTIGMDGDLTAYASGRVGASVGLRDVNIDSGQEFVVTDSQDRIVFAPAPEIPVLDWAHWGDSLTDDLNTGAEAWVTKLSAMTGRNHFNGGWYAQKHDQIAARQGGLPALVTVTNNVTAASGGTVVTSILNSPVLYSTTRSLRGTLAGIPGTIQQPYTTSTLFYPDVPGVYPIPPKSRFIASKGARNRDRHVTIWSGRNNVSDTDPALIVASVQAMIQYLSPSVKRVMVMEVVPSTADGVDGKAKCNAINAALKAAFPAYWLPIASWLRTTEAATAAGTTFTSQDQADIANGDTPSSFRSDSLHLNGTGCTAVAYRVYQEAQKRGWL